MADTKQTDKIRALAKAMLDFADRMDKLGFTDSAPDDMPWLLITTDRHELPLLVTGEFSEDDKNPYLYIEVKEQEL